MSEVELAAPRLRRATKRTYSGVQILVNVASAAILVSPVFTWILDWKPSVTLVVAYCFLAVPLVAMPWWLLYRARRMLASTRDRVSDLETRLDIPFPKVRSFQSPLRRKNRTEVVVKGLRSATSSIDACGIANEMITTDLPQDFLNNFFERGGRLRAIFIDPTPTGVVGDRERAEGHATREDTLAVKASRNIRNLLSFEAHLADLRVQWRDYDGSRPLPSIEIRTYDTAPKVNMLIVDSAWALVHYYGEATAGTASPVVEVDARLNVPNQLTPESQVQAKRASHRTRDALNFYVQDFEALWAKARPVPRPLPEEWA